MVSQSHRDIVQDSSQVIGFEHFSCLVIADSAVSWKKSLRALGDGGGRTGSGKGQVLNGCCLKTGSSHLVVPTSLRE